MMVLDGILEVLADGEWHHLTEISAKAKPLRELSITDLETILYTLSEYDFVEIGEEPHFVLETRINPIVRDFWKKIKWIERKEENEKVMNF